LLNTISNIIKGAVLGLAMIIPGISGGTLALMLGIYERLIRALRGFSLSTLREVSKLLGGPERKSGAAALWRSHDMSFLAVLLGGALLSVFAFSHLLEDLLTSHPKPTYGFFFGLVAASIVFPFRLAERKSMVELCCALVAIGLSIALSSSRIDPGQNLENDPYSLANCARFAICGMLASSAMLLPGISGSFLLLLLGIYQDVLRIVNERDYLLLSVFIGGCLLGLALFARLIHFLLNRYHSPTMAFLGGLMAGSLWMLWPFKNPASGHPSWPGEGEDSVGISLAACLAAIVIIAAFACYDRKAKGTADQSIGR
jgi:putative membrane protein